MGDRRPAAVGEAATETRTSPGLSRRSPGAVGVRVLRLLVVLAVAVAGAWLGLRILGVDRHTIGPFTVSMQTRFGAPGTDLALPPLGTVRVATHRAPLALSVTLRGIDVDRLRSMLRGSTVTQIAAELEAQVPPVIRSHALRTVAAAGAGALLLGLLVFRRRWRSVALATGVSVAVMASAGGLAYATYRPEAFREPTFQGSLALAPGLVGPLGDAAGRISEFRAALERLVRTASGAYSIAALPQPDEAATVLLHVSDVHSSILGMDFVQGVAESFDADLVVDTGDLTAFGSPVEADLLRRIRNLGRPYVFVRGNHDTAVVDAAIDRLPNGVVLHDRAVSVAGLRLYGAPHPVEQATDGTIPEDEFADRVEAAGENLANDIEALGEPPDVLAVHDDRMAEASAGLVPLVLSGHFHERSERTEDGTLFLRGGAASGGGLFEPFSLESVNRLAVQVVYFEDRVAVAYDIVELDLALTEVTVRRHLIERPRDDLRPEGEDATSSGR